MAKKPNATLVGAFILGGLVLMVGAIATWGSLKLFEPKYRFVCFFSGSVNGLNIGTPVKYRGVSVGSVVEIRLRFMQAPDDPRIPVFIELYGKRMRELGLEDKPDLEMTRDMVERGLRARLETMSLVTGQLYVNLDVFPDTKAELVQDKFAEIPTLPNKMEEATRSISSILNQLEQADFKGIAKSLASAVEGINKVVNQRDIRIALAEIPPTLISLREAFNDLREGINGVKTLITARGPIAMEMHRTLQDLQKAAGSVRVLAEFLQRNPNALIVGKKKEK
jgi:paraquat-inducible protein B